MMENAAFDIVVPREWNNGEIALVSIAISLKRIADALNNPDPYDNPIARAILNGISTGAQDWIGHMARSGR